MLSVGLLGLAVFVLARTPSVMPAYALATGGLLLFMHLKVNQGLRHGGHPFLVLVACLWLSWYNSWLQRAGGSDGLRPPL